MKTSKLRALAMLTVSAMLLAMLGACGGGSDAPAPSGGDDPAAQGQTEPKPATSGSKTLTVYTALPEAEFPVYLNAFQKDTGIKIECVRLSAGEMLARVKAEASHPNATLMYGGSSDNYISAAQDGLLEAYQSPELANIPEQYHDADGAWNPFYVGAICFACNKDWFQKNDLEYPKSWADLLKPEFKGQISMAHPSTSGTSYTVLATLVQLMGEDGAWSYFDQLNANIRHYTKAGAAVPQEVGLGEAAIGITFSHDALMPANEGYPIELSFPDDGTGYEVGAMALIKGGPADEQENAKAFIDWQLSKRGQECFIESKSNRLPINTEAKITDGLTKISDLKVIDYDAVWAGENRTRLVEAFTEKVDSAKALA